MSLARKPTYRLPQPHRVFPERSFPREVAALSRHHPPEEGWEVARAAFLALFRDTYEEGRTFLHHRYQAGASGREIVAGHAFLTDRLLQHLWRVLATYLALARRSTPLCLAAVGGYGRAQLHPHSDVDLLLLHEENPETAAAFAEPMLHFLWDMGIPVSHALRTPEQCVSDAAELTIQTNLLEARPLAGDSELFQRFETQFRARVLTDPEGFAAAKEEEQRRRHARYGGPVYNLEPNVKEGWGGLRDIHLLFWLARYRYDAASLRDLVDHGILSAGEYRTLDRAQEFLWRVRNGLHYLAGRNENRLLFDHQQRLSAELGYRETAATLAVEKLMKRYYRTLRQVVALTNIGRRILDETASSQPEHRLGPELIRQGEYLEATDPEGFAGDPGAMIPFFEAVQELTPLPPFGARTLRGLWQGAAAVTEHTRGEERVRTGLLRILGRAGRTAEVLRRMNTYGVLGRLVPDFGRIVGQTQHNLFHIYPVDEHTLGAMAVADRFYNGDPEVAEDSALACRLAPQNDRPELLYLGLFCHDIAKGQAGDHSVLGARVGRRLARWLGLGRNDAETVAWLVRDHLYLSQTSQKRDIHDPETIRAVAERVGDSQRLDLLFLLTEADMRATGPKVWNAWKAQLLQDLYLNARQTLRAGAPGNRPQRARKARRHILECLVAEGFQPSRVRRHLRRLDRDYLLHYHPEELVHHSRVLAATEGPTAVTVAPHVRAGGTEILLYAPDRPGLFTLASGSLAALGLNIVEAKAHTTDDGQAIDTFLVLDHEDRPISDPTGRANIRARLQEALERPDAEPPAPSRQAFRERIQRHFPTPVEVTFYPSASGNRTVVEVIAPDAPGVLYRIARILSANDCEIHAAKVATFGERTEDTFTVTRGGAPLSDQNERRDLAQAIREEFAITEATESD